MEKQIILSNLIKYLKLKDIPIKKSGKIIMLECPLCNSQPNSANVIPNTNIINCFKCKKKYNLLDIADKLEKDFPNKEKDQLHFLKKLLKINIKTEVDIDNINQYLDFYEKNHFDLVPIIANGKRPIEKNWTNKSHKNRQEWQTWIANNHNIGVKTGKISNITVIDIDAMPSDMKDKWYKGKLTKEEKKEAIKIRDTKIKMILDDLEHPENDTLYQTNLGGMHLFYKYISEFPKTSIDYKEIKIDVENDGGQVVIYPSSVFKTNRIFKLNPIKTMPKKIKKFFTDKITTPKKTHSEDIKEAIETENFQIDPSKFLLKNNNLEGVCNNEFIKLGGILRKRLNLKQTEYVLNMLNQHMLENPMQSKTIRSMMRELDKYQLFDEDELANKIQEYLKDVEEASRTEIALAVVGTNRGEDKKRVDKVLKHLVKESYIIKKGRSYLTRKKVEWREELINIGTPIDFQMPYFNDVMTFNYGDLVLIGSKNAHGKTHIAMNIVKQLVDQKIIPYYLSLEGGCFDEQTEILTEQGWKYFKDLNRKEKVMTLNPDTEEIEYQKPTKYFEYNYDGNLININTRYLDLLITPNHKQPSRVRTTGKIRLYNALDLPYHNPIPKTGNWKGENQKYFILPGITWNKYLGKHKKYYKIKEKSLKIKMEDWVKFFGLFLAEGSVEKYRVSISQFRNNKKFIEVKNIMDKFPFSYTYSNHQFRIIDKRLGIFLKKFGKSNEKYIPDELKKLNPKLLSEFLYGYYLGDGCYKNKRREFYTVSKKLAGDLQEIITKTSNFANISVRKCKNTKMTINGKSYTRKHNLYIVSEITTVKDVYAKRQNRRNVYYKGKIYDVEVPKHHILLVRRNGKNCWSGNSRWAKIALQLGLKEGDFKWHETSNPHDVELEKNSVTIIDWLCPKNYAETDKILQSLNDEVRDKNGILIVFMQLRDNNEWLAKDLVKQFPSFACRYIYDNESSGEYGKFKIDKIREAKIRIKSYELPARYNWETKKLSRIDKSKDEEIDNIEDEVLDE